MEPLDLLPGSREDGRVVADLVTGHKPEIDLDGLTIARYRA